MNNDIHNELTAKMNADLRSMFNDNVKACGRDCGHIKRARGMVERGLATYSRRDLERFIITASEEEPCT
ncbi:MAG: hypothetical protein WA125_04705 [Desulfosporosinus sp.]